MLEAISPIAWPSPPARLSFSALETITSCPRRWAYGRARYAPGGLADDRGVFLRRASWSAIRGDVIHEVLEHLLEVHQRAGGPPPGTWALVKFWRDHLPAGGVPALVAARAAAVIERRTSDRRNRLLRPGMVRLAAREADTLVASVNAKLRYALVERPARSSAPHAAWPGGHGAAPPERRDVVPEQRLECSLKSTDGSCDWLGDADVVRVTEAGAEIIDYKTGAPKESHRRQLELYALLFARDRQRNPRGTLANQLRVVYEAGQTETWPAPDPRALRQLEDSVVKESLAATDAVRQVPPLAQVGDACAWCDARPVCEDYWRSAAGAAVTAAGQRRDLQVTVLSVARGAAEVGAFDGQQQLRLLLTQVIAAACGDLLPGMVLRVIGAKRVQLEDEPSTELSAPVYEVNESTEVVRLSIQPESAQPG